MYEIANTVLYNGTVGASATVSTDSVKTDRATGYVQVWVSSSAASTLAITQQCSYNNKDWFDPYEATGAAMPTAATGVLFTATAVSTNLVSGRWFIFTKYVSCPYARFKIVESAAVATTLVLRMMFQEPSN
jgi:hypothetical protein